MEQPVEEFLEAVAQSLRNLGYQDAEASNGYVRLRGCLFGATYYGRNVRYCDATFYRYRGRFTDQNAVAMGVALTLAQLPAKLRYKEKRDREEAAQQLVDDLCKNCTEVRLDSMRVRKRDEVPGLYVGAHKTKFIIVAQFDDFGQAMVACDRISEFIGGAS